MALKSTIYKAEIQIANMDTHYYANHPLTLAKHPSETEERLMVRLIAFTLFADETLMFGKGLSEEDEADLWQRDLTNAITLWIDVGLPVERSIRKACGKANKVAVLVYGGNAADIWWSQNSKHLLKLNNLTVISIPHTKILSEMCNRNMQLSCTIQDAQLLISDGKTSLEILPTVLK
jgi:uncharacterized protein YaeQ